MQAPELISVGIFIFSLIAGAFSWQIKRVFEKMERVLSEDETRQLINDKLEPLRVEINQLKDSVQRMENALENKLDILIGLIHGKN